MELQDLKQLWLDYDQKLDKQVQLNLRLIKTLNMDKTKSALGKFIKTPALGLAIGFIVLLFLGGFIYEHFGQPRYAATAALIWPFAFLQVAFSGYQLSVILPTSEGGEMNFNLPVLEIQKKLEKLSVYRIRYLSVTRFAYGLLWLPVLIVGLKAFWDFDFYLYFDKAWVLTILSVGVVCVALGVWLSRKFAAKEISSPLLKKIRGSLSSSDVTGKSLVSALAFLKEIEDFEEEG